MSKYLEFKEIPFKGKTQRFNVLSKTSFDECPRCAGTGNLYYEALSGEDLPENCHICKGTGSIPIILGRIQWYSQWRQYVFMPSYPTTWNRDCMNDIIFFITNLMRDRKIILMENKNE